MNNRAIRKFEAIKDFVVNIFQKPMTKVILGCLLFLLFLYLFFPPDIHWRIAKIRRIQPERGYFLTDRGLAKDLDSLRFDLFDEDSKPVSVRRDLINRLPMDFNVNKYLKFLDRLKLQNGYELDYVYDLTSLDGRPYLYCRKENSERAVILLDLYEMYGELKSRIRKNECNAYLKHIETDGSREAFIQLAVLNLIGAQFYLHWHSNYNDTMILSRIPAWVTFYPNEVSVSLLIYTQFGGVKLYSTTLKRSFPHEFISESKTTILPISRGFRY